MGRRSGLLRSGLSIPLKQACVAGDEESSVRTYFAPVGRGISTVVLLVVPRTAQSLPGREISLAECNKLRYEHNKNNLDICMSDDPMDRIPAHDRVSIRAVLVREGEDPGSALARAGIYDAIALPVVVGDSGDLSGGILGDGMTSNVSAVLETEHPDDADSASYNQHDSDGSQTAAVHPAKPGPTMLPAAFGLKSRAPVRPLSGA